MLSREPDPYDADPAWDWDDSEWDEDDDLDEDDLSYDDEWNEYERKFYEEQADKQWDDSDCDDMILDDLDDPADELIAADPAAFKAFAEDFNAENGGN